MRDRRGQKLGQKQQRTKDKYSHSANVKLGLLTLLQRTQPQIITLQKLKHILSNRNLSFQYRLPSIIYTSLRYCHQLDPQTTNPFTLQSQAYSHIVKAKFCFMSKSSIITMQKFNEQWIQITFCSWKEDELHKVGRYQLKYRGNILMDYGIYQTQSLPITLISFEHIVFGSTCTLQTDKQKHLFQYTFDQKIKKSILISSNIFILTQCGRLYFGKTPQKINVLLFKEKLKVKQLQKINKQAVVLTKNFIIIIFNMKGQKKKTIRTGIEISNMQPLGLKGQNLIFLIKHKQNGIYMLKCGKQQSSDNKIWKISSQLQDIQRCHCMGKWLLIKTLTNKVYLMFSDDKQDEIIVEIYKGELQGMGEALYFQLLTKFYKQPL